MKRCIIDIDASDEDKIALRRLRSASAPLRRFGVNLCFRLSEAGWRVALGWGSDHVLGDGLDFEEALLVVNAIACSSSRIAYHTVTQLFPTVFARPVDVVVNLDDGMLQDVRVYAQGQAAFADLDAVREDMKARNVLDPSSGPLEAIGTNGEETRLWEEVEIQLTPRRLTDGNAEGSLK